MSSTYYRVIKRQPPIIRRKLENLFTLLLGDTTADELGQKIAAEVLRNFKIDGTMKSVDLRNFIKEIIDQIDNGVISDIVTAKAAFLNACYSRQRLGAITLSTTEFWIVIPEKKLLATLNKANNEFPYNIKGITWATFLNYYNLRNITGLGIILGDAEINVNGFQVFTTFSHPSRPSSFPSDPSYWSDAATACAALGLSKGYRVGDRIWLLKYEFGHYLEQHLPTFADADWRSIFRPSKSRRSNYGLTIPLGSLRLPRTRRRHPEIGMPEIVHDNSRFVIHGSIFSSTNNLKLLDVKDLGIHNGW
jgi:hypothetical protein